MHAFVCTCVIYEYIQTSFPACKSVWSYKTYALLRTKRLKLEQVISVSGRVGGSFRHARETRLR